MSFSEQTKVDTHGQSPWNPALRVYWGNCPTFGAEATSEARPIFAGWVFDRTESYSTVLLVFLAILLTACLMFTVLRPPALEPRLALEP